MTVRIERVFDLAVPIDDVWAFISDPANRADAISIVDRYEVDGDRATWHVRLPIPMLNQTVPVETEDVERNPPNYVKFVGRSSALRVTGEHELAATETGTRLTNRFVVEGRIPGVERFFERNLDRELDNLEAALEEVEETA